MIVDLDFEVGGLSFWSESIDSDWGADVGFDPVDDAKFFAEEGEAASWIDRKSFTLAVPRLLIDRADEVLGAMRGKDGKSVHKRGKGVVWKKHREVLFYVGYLLGRKYGEDLRRVRKTGGNLGDWAGWTRLHYKTLRTQVPEAAWNLVRDAMAQCKLIEIDGEYRFGEVSYSKNYRLRPDTFGVDPEFAKVRVSHKTIVRALNEYWRRVYCPEFMNSWQVTQLSQNLRYLRVDEEAASKATVKILEDYRQKLKKKGFRGEKLEERLRIEQKRLESCVRVLDDLRVTNSWELAKCDVFGWRHWTPITNLNKAYRKCLFIEKDGRKHSLVTVDISNSQPLMLGMAMWLAGKKINSNQEEKNQSKGIKGISFIIARFFAALPSGVVDAVRAISCEGNGHSQFFADCLAGRFNASLASSGVSKDMVKDRIFKEVLFNSELKDPWRNSSSLASIRAKGKTQNQWEIGLVREAFEHRYPKEFGIVKSLKTCGLNREFDRWLGDSGVMRESGQYRLSSMMLQRLESVFVRHEVLPLFWWRCPDAFALTLHDSLIVAEGNEEAAAWSIKEAMKRLVGRECAVKPEKWC